MKNKKRMKQLTPLLLLLIPLFLYVGINAYALISGEREIDSLRDADPSEQFDAILILGAGVRSDGTPSHMLEDRLLTAVELYNNEVCSTVIVSGDHGQEHYDEVNTMKDYLIQKGIPSSHIFMDHAGFSTYDSLYRAKEIFGANRLLIVTQRYHAYRALMIGRMLGVECRAVAAPILATDAKSYAGQSWYSLRESVARCKDFFYGLVQPEPVYLGEKISLSASGDVTNDKV